MDKRGQGLSTNAIILIILGVFVLVILILGFTLGWDKLAPWLSKDKNNVDTIATQCEIACTTQSFYDFCEKERTLIIDKTTESTQTCEQFSRDDVYKKYIDECPGLCGEIIVDIPPEAGLFEGGETPTE